MMLNQMRLLFCVTLVASQQKNELEFWNLDRPKDMANIASLEVMCGKTHMEVQINFDRSFNGIIFSKGAVDQYNCIYVKPQTGSSAYSFNILYNQCGTKPDMNGKFYENNIVIQYDKDLIEVWDEAKRLRCEWYNDYEKGITKAPIRVSDLEVVELNFRGDNVDSWMEIQYGKGPWASVVSGIVPLGTTLTMVVGINDKQGEFDMRVKSCLAEAENSKPIQLTDEHGCVLRPKMISKLMKIAGADSRASVITYAFFHAFKFPDSMSVHIKCKVEICRFGCPSHCQKPDNYQSREQDVQASMAIPKLANGPRYESRISDQENYSSKKGKNIRFNAQKIQQRSNATKTFRKTIQRNKRSTDEGERGVTSGYQVISEVDLDFKTNFENGKGITVFKGKMMSEDIVYGVCFPASSFSVLFVVLSLITVLSVLVSGFVCYNRQLRKNMEKNAPML